jgi:hypothetical protein
MAPLADHIQLPLKGQIILQTFTALDENLTEKRLTGLRRLADHGIVGRHISPTDHLLAFFGTIFRTQRH